MNFKTGLFLTAILTSMFVLSETAQAQNTGYYPHVFARGMDRQIIRSLPIEMRPNRPFHFYGNAVRRINNRPALAQSRRFFQPLLPQLPPPRRIGQRIPFNRIFRR